VAVESVPNQTLAKDEYEVIVSKNFDCEYDEEWRRRGVKLIRFDSGGCGEQVAHALPHCRGEVIAFLDDDDWWAPNKLEIVSKVFSDSPVVYYHNAMYMFGGGRPPMKSPIKGKFNDSSVSVRKSLLIDNVPYLQKVLILVDMFYWIIARLSGGEMVNGSIPLTYYRVSSLSKNAMIRNSQSLRDVELFRRIIAESGNLRFFKEYLEDEFRYGLT